MSIETGQVISGTTDRQPARAVREYVHGSTALFAGQAGKSESHPFCLGVGQVGHLCGFGIPSGGTIRVLKVKVETNPPPHGGTPDCPPDRFTRPEPLKVSNCKPFRDCNGTVTMNCNRTGIQIDGPGCFQLQVANGVATEQLEVDLTIEQQTHRQSV